MRQRKEIRPMEKRRKKIKMIEEKSRRSETDD
jgi:hypothetical protein